MITLEQYPPATARYWYKPEQLQPTLKECASLLKTMPRSKNWFSKFAKKTGFIASHFTADVRYQTQSKSFPTLWDIWYRDTELNGKRLPQFSVTSEFYEKHIRINEGKPYSAWRTIDIRALITEFHNYAYADKFGYAPISMVPNSFPGELLSQVMDNEHMDVLDPTAGWGDRYVGALIYAIAYPKRKIRYTGIDINNKLEAAYRELTRTLTAPNFQGNFIIGDALEVMPSLSTRKLIFTSTPYYIMEDTLNNQYTSFDDWVERWYGPFLLKCKEQVDGGARLILHVADLSWGSMDDPINNYLPNHQHRIIYNRKHLSKSWKVNLRKPHLHVVD